MYVKLCACVYECILSMSFKCEVLLFLCVCMRDVGVYVFTYMMLSCFCVCHHFHVCVCEYVFVCFCVILSLLDFLEPAVPTVEAWRLTTSCCTLSLLLNEPR